METVLYMVVMLGVTGCVYSQVITVAANNSHNKLAGAKCGNTSNSVLIEHFFNVIFNEFHNTPPVCICVQMCPEVPTYCYPNGCLKKGEAAKKPEVPQVINVSEHSKPIFFLDDRSDFINDFIDKNYVDENKAAVAGHKKIDNSLQSILRPDPFKDRYKIMFKYKKMPKVELKYNLGEQVKNMKSDSLKKEHADVSNTRWPMNKMNNYLGQRLQSKSQENSKFFMAMSPGKELENYPPKYFKRELTDSTNIDDDGVDTKAKYVVGESSPETTTFSLEKLIDSLIDNNFEVNKTSNMVINKTENKIENKNEIIMENIIERKIENKMENKIENKIEYEIENKTEEKRLDGKAQAIETIEKNSTTKQALPAQNPNNDTTNVISMNLTDENVDKNKYMKTNTDITKAFSEMTALSRKIDIQNNTSLEMMRRMTNDFNVNPTNSGSNQSESSKPMEHVVITTTDTTLTTVDYDSRTTKKIRQRLARRLQYSKNN